MSKTVLEHFNDIEEVEVADGTVATVKDMLPYKCKQVEKSLKAIEIIKKKGLSIVEVSNIRSSRNYEEYECNMEFVYYSSYEKKQAMKTKDEFELLKEVLG